MKELKRIIKKSADREHKGHQKQILKNFAEEQMAAFVSCLAQFDVHRQTAKLFDYTKKSMRNVIQLNERQSHQNTICLESRFPRI